MFDLSNTNEGRCTTSVNWWSSNHLQTEGLHNSSFLYSVTRNWQQRAKIWGGLNYRWTIPFVHVYSFWITDDLYHLLHVDRFLSCNSHSRTIAGNEAPYFALFCKHSKIARYSKGISFRRQQVQVQMGGWEERNGSAQLWFFPASQHDFVSTGQDPLQQAWRSELLVQCRHKT